MNSLWMVLFLIHLVGLVMAVGAATVKLRLLLKTGTDPILTSAYLRLAPAITGVLLVGMILLTLSGIGWLILGARFTPLLITKLVLVAAMWGVGPIIDLVFEPPFMKSAPPVGGSATEEFVTSRRRLITIEVLATGLFYVIAIMGAYV